ncbi:PilT/PilU family type 4a pilus ATPase [bacterium]|nr:PilT/PilU family type 4a pilus ATPase [bacterium]
MDINEILQLMIKKGISDIHFKAGVSPLVRINGKLIATAFEGFTPKHIEEIAYKLMNPLHRQIFEREKELDFSHTISGVSRFRVNVYRQKGSIALTLRVIPLEMKKFEDLNLPMETLIKLCQEQRGLILITGVTGAGKTTTMNTMIDYINKNRACNIITVEDPIEFYHQDEKATISQREVGEDTNSFSSALRYILRQDPDVIVLGEMRDFETIRQGILAAETGHLVFSTIHTLDAVQTLDRIVSLYPSANATEARIQLANVLRGIVAQRLIPGIDGESVVPATEILIGTSLIKKLILDAQNKDLYKVMEQGEFYGMKTFDQAIYQLYMGKKISLENALEYATNPDNVMLKMRGISKGEN